MSDKEKLIEQKAKLEQEILEIEKLEAMDLVVAAKNSGIQRLQFMAEAMIHERFGVKPTTPKLGYELSAYDDDSSKFSKDDRELYYKIIKDFDWIHYVFAHTHYDTYTGHFYRMS